MSSLEPLDHSDRTAYYAAVESWADDQSRLERASRRLAWTIATFAGTVALLEGLVLVAMMPLKTDVPYVVTVDRQSGYTEVAQRLQAGGALTQRDAVIQSALVQYVLARETFDSADLAQQYKRVQQWSDGPTARSYVAAMARSNPDSPLNLYVGSVTLKVTVKSVSLIDSKIAMVRFDTQRIDRASSAAPVQSYTATISFRFSGEPMTMEERFINPLGFQVTHYRRDAETPTPTPTPVAIGLIGEAQ